MTKLSQAARNAMIDSDKSSGRLPQGTPSDVVTELRGAGYVLRDGLTMRGRVIRERLVDEMLEF
jgi:hypothetical protein